MKARPNQNGMGTCIRKRYHPYTTSSVSHNTRRFDIILSPYMNLLEPVHYTRHHQTETAHVFSSQSTRNCVVVLGAFPSLEEISRTSQRATASHPFCFSFNVHRSRLQQLFCAQSLLLRLIFPINYDKCPNHMFE